MVINVIYDKLNKEQKKDFTSIIVDKYGPPVKLAKTLDLGIEMLFYFEEDTFDRRDVQSVVSAIRGIIGVLRREE